MSLASDRAGSQPLLKRIDGYFLIGRDAFLDDRRDDAAYRFGKPAVNWRVLTATYRQFRKQFRARQSCILEMLDKSSGGVPARCMLLECCLDEGTMPCLSRGKTVMAAVDADFVESNNTARPKMAQAGADEFCGVRLEHKDISADKTGEGEFMSSMAALPP